MRVMLLLQPLDTPSAVHIENREPAMGSFSMNRERHARFKPNE
jgi:hypothetical protein